MPFYMTSLAQMYITSKTAVDCMLSFTEVGQVCFAHLSVRTRHSCIFMIDKSVI